ncbi:MAG TPA: glycosyltransferase family 2 protein [Solirubrobacterales bacterium]
MAPKLTVVTPSFNQGRFIGRTIRSVLDQGYPDLEYVIVDGGSTDETVEVIRRYEDRLAWWVSEPDEGQTEAINKGIERTEGEIVAYLNSDDYYLPGALGAVADAFERTDRRWIAGAAVDIAEGDPPLELGVWQPDPPSVCERIPRGRHWWLLAPWHVPQPSAFWRRELFDRYGLFRTDMHFAFDAEFMVRLAIAGEMPELLRDEVLSARSEHPEQKSRRVTEWLPELRAMAALHRSELTPSERRRLTALGGPVRLSRALSTGVLDPAKRVGGRMLDHVPQRVRPAIRDRDKRPRLAEFPRRR